MLVVWKPQTCCMTVSSLDLSNRPDLSWLSELVSVVKAHARNLPLLLVGAVARDLLLTYAHNVEVARATQDIDLAFAVPDWQTYCQLRQSLIDTGDFEAVDVSLHRLRFRAFLPIDLIPFGRIERPDRSITWPPRQEEVMTVLGYREALSTAVEAFLPDNEQIAAVATKPHLR